MQKFLFKLMIVTGSLEDPADNIIVSDNFVDLWSKISKHLNYIVIESYTYLV